MRISLILVLFCYSLNVFSQSSVELYEKKYYFTSLHQFLLENSKSDFASTEKERTLEDLLSYTGVDVLNNYKSRLISKFQNSAVQMFNINKALEEKNYSSAIEIANQMHVTSQYKAEAIYNKIYALSLSGTDITTLASVVEECKLIASEKGRKTENQILKQYNHQIEEACIVWFARGFYNKKDWTRALEGYDKLSKKAYRWPLILLEKAWINFHLENYNRSLGLLVTYKNPLLENYFIPEVEYLTALNYYKLCLWDDSLQVIDNFYSEYKEKSDMLNANLMAEKNSQDYFYKLMILTPDERKLVHPFIHKLALQVQKQMRFILDYDIIKKIEKEISQIESSDLTDKLLKLKHLENLKESLVSKVNSYVKVDFFKKINNIYFVSEELFKLKLEILASKKDLIYKQKELIANRSRGSFENVKRSRFEQFWKFNGSFWADELGDYSFGLKSNCDLKRKSVE